MRFPSKQLSGKQKLWLLISIWLVATVLLIVVSFKQKSKRDKPTISDTTSYVDPGSGEVVSNPEGKAPENPLGLENNDPIFLGISKLLDKGVTSYQLDAIKQAFINYSRAGDKKLQEISITVATINRVAPDHGKNDDRDIITFEVVIDRDKKYQARVESQSIKVSRLYLSDESGNLIYDSYDIDATTAD